MTTTIALLLLSMLGPPSSWSVQAAHLPATTIAEGAPIALLAPTGERASAPVGASPLPPVVEGPGSLRSTTPSTPRGASGGSAWWNLTPVSPIAPSARAGAAVAWDALDGYVLLFGGIGPAGYLSDTWIFTSGRWASLTPSVHPSARSGSGIAFDPWLGAVVLFGGKNATGALGDTWWFAGGRWSLETPSIAPSPRDGSQAAYDSSARTLVLFGGRNASNAPLNDTWTYSGGPWTRWNGTIAPTPRLGATLTDDPPQAGVLLFGGSNGTIGNVLGDSWKFNGTGWSRLPGAFGPPARSNASAALDPVGPVELLFGGTNGSSAGYLDDLWDYANGTWAPVAALAGPSGRSGASIAWDALDGYLVLFGGSNASGWLAETWVFVRPLVVSLIVDAHLTDPGSPISVVANATGGIPPYDFSFQTSQGALRGSSSASQWNTSFGAPGVVAVTGTAVDRVGASASSALSVTVVPPPTLSGVPASLATDAFVPTTLEANGSGGVPPLELFWNLGDGGSAGAGRAVHTYLVPGTYRASANLRDALGRNASAAVEVTVHPLPRGLLSIDPTPVTTAVAETFRVTLSGGSGPISVRWTFGDGGTGFGAIAHHTFTTAGTFEVRWNVSDPIGGATSGVASVNVSAPSPLGASNAASTLWETGAALAVVAIAALVGIGLAARRRAGRRRARPSDDPGGEPGVPVDEEPAEAEVLAGRGEQYEQPEGGEGGIPGEVDLAPVGPFERREEERVEE